MPELSTYLRTFPSRGDIHCPRCRIGLRDAPTGLQCWKCLTGIGVSNLPYEYCHPVAPCQKCSTNMLFAGRDLVCPSCFHVSFEAGQASVKVPLLCLHCNGDIVRRGSLWICSGEEKLTCTICGGKLRRNSSNLTCNSCGESCMYSGQSCIKS